VSGEARWATYEMQSDFLPSDFVNCTGLRFCLANGAAPLLWVQNTVGEVDKKNHVYEYAVEFNIPLAKDIPARRVADLPVELDGDAGRSIRDAERELARRMVERYETTLLKLETKWRQRDNLRRSAPAH